MSWLLGILAVLAGLAFFVRRRLAHGPPPEPAPASPGGPDPDYALRVDDELDLHGVAPQAVGELVDAFVDDAAARRRTPLRIVHGKGMGALRALVRARLERHPAVRGFHDAPPPSSWGATIVHLTPPAADATGRREDAE